MKIDEKINVLTDICHLLDSWAQGACECGRAEPWSEWDEETRRKARLLLKEELNKKNNDELHWEDISDQVYG
jgi:hypothetical protein